MPTDGQLLAGVEGEIAELVMEDWQEAMVIDGESFIGALVKGSSVLSERAVPGSTSTDRAVVLYTDGAIDPQEGQHVTVSSSGNEYEVVQVLPPVNGLGQMECRETRIVSRGRL